MKVFLSSTFEDLEDERTWAMRALDHLGIEVVSMEKSAAASRTPLQDSLDKVNDCDCFVGIYAHRYGTIPEESEKSITEQEYDRAQKMKLKTFCFF
ncbi:MAG: DUF4062 domain-containing protein [Chlorobium sp.]